MGNKSKIANYVKRMKECDTYDTERGHIVADALLCEIIRNELGEDYKEVIEKYRLLNKWYA